VETELEAVRRGGVEVEHAVRGPVGGKGRELEQHPPGVGAAPAERQLPRPAPPGLRALAFIEALDCADRLGLTGVGRLVAGFSTTRAEYLPSRTLPGEPSRTKAAEGGLIVAEWSSTPSTHLKPDWIESHSQ
jgi:hypothetical protein